MAKRTKFSPQFNESQQTWVWFLLLGDDQDFDNGPAYVPKAIYDRLAHHDLEGANWKAYRWRAAAESAMVLARCDHPPGGSSEAYRIAHGIEWDGRLVPVNQLSYRNEDGSVRATERLSYKQALYLSQRSPEFGIDTNPPATPIIVEKQP